MKSDILLERYKTLILLSLDAQANDDIEREEKMIDALDVVWAKMSSDERLLTDKVNQEAIEWFDAGMRLGRQSDQSCNAQSIESLTRTSKVQGHSINVSEKSDVRFKKVNVCWRPLPLRSAISSRVDFLSSFAAA